MSKEATGGERRLVKRKIKPFYVAFSADGEAFVPAYGLDISSGGVGILTQIHTPDGEFKLRIMLEERDFIITVVRQREAERLRDGKTWYAAGVRTVSIEPDDATFVEKFVHDLAFEPSNVVLAELEQTLIAEAPDSAELENKRTVPRKRKPFYIAFNVTGVLFVPAYGLDLGRDGLRIFTEVEMPDEPFKIRIILKERDFIVTVKKVWDKHVSEGSRVGVITGTLFTEIDPVDREFVDDYVAGKEFFEGNKLLDALERLRAEPDRAHDFLPPNLLSDLLQRLVALKRLAPVSAETYPLVRYKYEGAKTMGDKRIHSLFIESRVVKRDGAERFGTHFGFDDTGSNVRLLR